MMPSSTALPPIRLGLLCDFLEEGWPSMDLVGAMIARFLTEDHAHQVAVTTFRPPFQRLGSRWPWPERFQGTVFNSDRLWNRLVVYPQALRRLVRRESLDLYHLVDHSYAHLVHELPPGRTIVTCHDLDTFRCLLAPDQEARPLWFRAMSQRILGGLQRAAAVCCVSEATRRSILDQGLIGPDRLHVVPNAVDPSCTPEPVPEADAEAERLLGPADPDRPPDLLYVGSNIPRKRIDVLLQVVAAVRRVWPGMRLIKAGGSWNADQARLAASLGLTDAVVFIPYLPVERRAVLGAIYRRAALVLQPSEAEGFGLPVAEALACGTPVLASELEVLREVGGTAAEYAPVGEVATWVERVLALLEERQHQPTAWHKRRERGLLHAQRYRWNTHVATLLAIYQQLVGNRSSRTAAVEGSAPASDALAGPPRE